MRSHLESVSTLILLVFAANGRGALRGPSGAVELIKNNRVSMRYRLGRGQAALLLRSQAKETGAALAMRIRS
jgi:hypothetical protein